MNYTAREIVRDRMRGDRRMRDRYDYRDGEMDREHHDRRMRDYRGEYYGEYYGDYGEDGRRSSVTGRYIRDRGEHHKRYDDDDVKLSRHELKEWKRRLKNADGSTGDHFTHEQIHEAAEHIGATYDGYDEHELCMTANMLYSDLCEALRSVIPHDKEATIYTKMAHHWLEDEDAPKGSEKLAMYYYCIVDGDEE